MRIAVEPLEYDEAAWIRIVPLGYINDLPALLRSVPGWRWKRPYGWHVPKTTAAWHALRQLFGQANIEIRTTPHVASTAPSPTECPTTLTEAQEEAVLQMIETLMLKRYSPRTIASYRSFFTSFLLAHADQLPAGLNETDIKRYLLRQIEQRQWSESTQNSCINAIKFYYEQVLGQPRKVYDFRPRKPKKLPTGWPSVVLFTMRKSSSMAGPKIGVGV